METKVRCYLTSCAILLELVAATAALAQRPERLFMSEGGGRWCAYSSEKELEDSPRDQDPEYVAIAERREGRLTIVRVRRSTEDTTTYDDYYITGGDHLTRLERRLDAIPERVTRIQTWNLEGKEPKMISESWMEFGSHKPLQPDNRLDEYVDHAVITRLPDFPFFGLIADSDGWTKGVHCIPGDAKSLEASTRR